VERLRGEPVEEVRLYIGGTPALGSWQPGNRINGLEAALATLIQNQAQFVSHLDENRQRFSRIEEELEAIKALLIRHERTLEQLPEAILDKIGFKGQ